MIDEDEKNKAIENQLKKDLNLANKDAEDVMNNVDKKRHKRETIKKIRLSLFSIVVNIAMTSYAIYVAVSEKNQLYWMVGFIFIGLTLMEILFIRRKLYPHKPENTNHVKYCAQVTDAHGNSRIKKQNVFSTVDDATDWVENIVKDGECGKIIDTANGKIIKTCKKKEVQ